MEENGSQKAKLSKKGCIGVNEVSTGRGNSLISFPGQFVHVECQKRYCNIECMNADKSSKK